VMEYARKPGFSQLAMDTCGLRAARMSLAGATHTSARWIPVTPAENGKIFVDRTRKRRLH
jgi:hypothetical protein